MILFIFLVILAYLMGSICSAVIVCKTCSLPDPRLEGSKNPGATNVLRIAGKQYAAWVLVADVLKGLIPVLIAKCLEAEVITVGFTALAAVIGHMYPAFFKFKGGKGVATAIGALLGVQFIVGVMVVATWLLVVKLSRYSSLASMVAICLAPFYSLLIIQNLNIFPPIFIMALLVLYKHKNNITRLMDGQEPKIKIKHSVLEDIMDDEPRIMSVKQEEVIITIPEEKPVAKPKAKITKTTTKTATKSTPKITKTTKTVTKTAEPAKKPKTTIKTPKKPAVPKAKTKKPKEE